MKLTPPVRISPCLHLVCQHCFQAMAAQ
ncbi:hypothetical protein JJQ34_23365 [Enterobacter cloacae]|nr:hypothetical protein [Enterobacter cloacae]